MLTTATDSKAHPRAGASDVPLTPYCLLLRPTARRTPGLVHLVVVDRPLARRSQLAGTGPRCAKAGAKAGTCSKLGLGLGLGLGVGSGLGLAAQGPGALRPAPVARG